MTEALNETDEFVDLGDNFLKTDFYESFLITLVYTREKSHTIVAGFA